MVCAQRSVSEQPSRGREEEELPASLFLSASPMDQSPPHLGINSPALQAVLTCSQEQLWEKLSICRQIGPAPDLLWPCKT